MITWKIAHVSSIGKKVRSHPKRKTHFTRFRLFLSGSNTALIFFSPNFTAETEIVPYIKCKYKIHSFEKSFIKLQLKTICAIH
jgi:hypothetical protein